MRPMLATPSDAVPEGDGWWHEIKWDGMRVLADVRDHRLRLTSRSERDITATFPELSTSEAGLTAYADVLLDGELVSMEDGRPSFSALAHRAHARGAPRGPAAPAAFMVFDVLRAAGTDVAHLPLRERRALLEGIDLQTQVVRTPPVFTDGAALLDATADQAMEGVVSKRVESSYRPGRRSTDWLKVVHRHTGSFLIGGMRPQVGGGGLGAVLLGTPTPDGLRFRGRVGAGLRGSDGDALERELSGQCVEQSPFAGALPPEDVKGTTWVRPTLIADVGFLSAAPGGRLRQPVWRGLRPDLEPADLRGHP